MYPSRGRLPRFAVVVVALLAVFVLATPSAFAQRLGGPAQRPAGVVARVGYGVGMAAGVAVTAALRVSSRWNAPLLDRNGRAVVRAPGVTRIGAHPILVRHQEVVGPRITARATQMRPGVARRFVAGLGAGATRAPGATYRLEVRASDALARLHGRR